MTPEQQRIAIAEACGYLNARYASPNICIASVGETPFGLFWGTCGVPDYLNDLNAMHEAEKAMVNLGLYRKFLYLVVLDDPTNAMNDTAFATASQRAESFLRTLSLWARCVR